MRHYYFFLLFFAIFTLPPAHAQMPCCNSSAPQQFAALGSEPAFKQLHPRPKPANYTAAGTIVSFSTPDGKQGRAFMLSARVPSNKYLFIFHEWWGLNDNIRQEAKKYFDDLNGVNVMAIDLYDGKTADNAEQAKNLMQQASDERIRNIIKGAIDYCGSSANIGSLGWCYGGAWSLQAAIMLGDKADGCVMFYGMPEQDVNQLKKLRTPVLGIFALNDPWISPEVVEEFRVKMKEADRSLELIHFEANHAFANPSNENYHRVAAGKAYSAALSFLRGHLNN